MAGSERLGGEGFAFAYEISRTIKPEGTEIEANGVASDSDSFDRLVDNLKQIFDRVEVRNSNESDGPKAFFMSSARWTASWEPNGPGPRPPKDPSLN